MYYLDNIVIIIIQLTNKSIYIPMEQNKTSIALYVHYMMVQNHWVSNTNRLMYYEWNGRQYSVFYFDFFLSDN